MERGQDIAMVQVAEAVTSGLADVAYDAYQASRTAESMVLVPRLSTAAAVHIDVVEGAVTLAIGQHTVIETSSRRTASEHTVESIVRAVAEGRFSEQLWSDERGVLRSVGRLDNVRIAEHQSSLNGSRTGGTSSEVTYDPWR